MQAIELILRRVVLMIVILFAVSFLTFLIVHVLPGDVANAILGDLATPDQVELVRQRMGLNEPVLLRYWHWVTAFASGDFGVSLAYNTPIAPLVFERLANSVLLALISLGVAVPVSVALGVLAAWLVVMAYAFCSKGLRAFAHPPKQVEDPVESEQPC